MSTFESPVNYALTGSLLFRSAFAELDDLIHLFLVALLNHKCIITSRCQRRTNRVEGDDHNGTSVHDKV